MGKIHDAVNKVRDTQRAGGQTSVYSGGAARNAAYASGGLQVPVRNASVLAQAATYHPLDDVLLDQNRIIASPQPSQAMSSYKMLRTRILHQLRTNNWKRIAISSARQDSGKTLTAINTAISLSSDTNQQGVRVDVDLRRPSVAQTLGIEHEAGLTDYLQGEADIGDIVVRTQIERLLIVPNYGKLEYSSEMLTSHKMNEFIGIVSADVNSTIVLFDLPPLLEADDLLAISPQTDALLLVVAESETRRTDLQKSITLAHELNMLGYVLNKSRGEDYSEGYYY